jgi:hypothetical protein
MLQITNITTAEEKNITVDDYEVYDDTWISSMCRMPDTRRCGSHTEKRIKTKFWIPKQLSSEELFEKLIVRKDCSSELS